MDGFVSAELRRRYTFFLYSVAPRGSNRIGLVLYQHHHSIPELELASLAHVVNGTFIS
jgi:hypothetical protein